MFKNFLTSISVRILSTAISLLVVPLLLHILTKEQYGTWVTLSSLTVWISLFDLGIGYGLKNSVTRYIANNSVLELKNEIFGYIKFLIIVSGILLLVFFILLPFVDIFRGNVLPSICLFGITIALLPLSLAANMLQGARKIALQSVLSSINSILWFTSLLLINNSKNHVSILEISIISALSIAIMNIAMFYFAQKKLGIMLVDIAGIFRSTLAINKMHVSLKYFGLQISTIVLYGFGNYITYHSLGPVEVARYDVLNKLFMFGMSIFNIGISVLWPEYVHCTETKNIAKSRRLFLFSIAISLIFSLGSFLIALISPLVVNLWTSKQIATNRNEAFAFAALISIQSFAYCGAVVLNAYERLNMQLMISLLMTILMVPFAFLFFKLGFGIKSVPVTAAMLTMPSLVYCVYDAYSVLWNKKILNN